jgi:CHAT domain-containing protein
MTFKTRLGNVIRLTSAALAIAVLSPCIAVAQPASVPCAQITSAPSGDACLAWAFRALASAEYYTYPKYLEAFVKAKGISIEQRTRAQILLAAAYLEADRSQDLNAMLTSALGQDWDSMAARLAPYWPNERAIAWYALLKSTLSDAVSDERREALATRFVRDYAEGLKRERFRYPAVSGVGGILRRHLADPSSLAGSFGLLADAMDELPEAKVEGVTFRISEAEQRLRANQLDQAQTALEKAEKALPAPPWRAPLLAVKPDDADASAELTAELKQNAMSWGRIASLRAQFAGSDLASRQWALVFSAYAFSASEQPKFAALELVNRADVFAAVGRLHSARIYLGRAAEELRNELNMNLPISLRGLSFERFTADMPRLSALARPVIREYARFFLPTVFEDGFARQQALDAAELLLTAGSRPPELTNVLRILASKVQYPVDACRALMLLAASENLSRRDAAAQDYLNRCAALSKTLDNPRALMWSRAVYARILRDEPGEISAIEQLVSGTAEIREPYEVVAVWRLADLKEKSKQLSTAYELLTGVRRELKEAGNASVIPVLGEETELRFARLALATGDFANAYEAAAALGNREIANGVSDGMRLAESAAISALASRKLGKDDASRWARISRWHGAIARPDSSRVLQLRSSEATIEALALESGAAGDIDGLPETVTRLEPPPFTADIRHAVLTGEEKSAALGRVQTYRQHRNVREALLGLATLLGGNELKLFQTHGPHLLEETIAARSNKQNACADAVLASEFLVTNAVSRKVADLLDSEISKNGSDQACSATYRVRLIAARTSAAVRLGEPVEDALRRLLAVTQDIAASGRVSVAHPLGAAIVEFSQAARRAGSEELLGPLAGEMNEIFSPAGLFGTGRGEELLKAIGLNRSAPLLPGPYLRLANAATAYATVTRAPDSKLKRRMLRLVELSPYSPERDYWRKEAEKHDADTPDPSSLSPLYAAVNGFEEAFNQDPSIDIRAPLANIQQAALIEQRTPPAMPAVDGDPDGRTAAIQSAFGSLTALARKVLQSADKAAGLAIADTLIDATGKLPVPDANKNAWDVLKSVLTGIILEGPTENARIFSTRAGLLVERASQPVIGGAEDDDYQAHAATLLTYFRSWTGQDIYQELVKRFDPALNKVYSGTADAEWIKRSAPLIIEVVLGKLPATDLRGREEKLTEVLQFAPDAEVAQYLRGRAIAQIADEALEQIAGLSEAGNYARAKELSDTLTGVIGRIRIDGDARSEHTADSVRLASTMVEVCTADSRAQSSLSLDPPKPIKRNEDIRAEIAIARALMARGFDRQASDRLRLVLETVDSLPEQRDRQRARIDISRLLAVQSLLERSAEEAMRYFSSVWDASLPGIAARNQVGVAHVLLSVGQRSIATDLHRQLEQALPSQQSTSDLAASINFLGARQRFAAGDTAGALDLVAASRKARKFDPLEFLFESSLDEVEQRDQPLFTVLAGRDPSFSAILAPNVPRALVSADAPPDTHLKVALAAADALRREGKALTAEQRRIVLHELRLATRSRTTITYMRAQAVKALQDDDQKDSFRKIMLQERVQRGRRLRSTIDFDSGAMFANWPPKWYSAPDYFSEHAPCEQDPARSQSARERSIFRIFESMGGIPAVNPLSTDMDSSAIRGLMKKLSADVLLNPQQPDNAQLADNEAAVVVTGSGRMVYTTLIRKNDVRVFQAEFLGDDPDIEALVAAIRTTIQEKKKERDAARAELRTLARLLLWPSLPGLSEVKSVIIVTRGAISGLPLHLLPLPETSPNVEASRFDRRFSSRVVPGLDPLLAESLDTDASPSRVKDNEVPFLAIADPAHLGSEEECQNAPSNSLRTEDGFIDPRRFTMFCSVPQTKKTAWRLNRLLAGSKSGSDQSWLRSGIQAREPDVVNDPRLAQARVILFATHGLTADEVNRASGVRQPGLVLTPPVGEQRPEAWRDGILTATEIVQRFRLKAEWVVLVACNSAAGDGSANGEALSGLAEAFIAAGAGGVIVSYWQVDADTSGVFLSKVFDSWGKGQKMNDALALAMQAMRDGSIISGEAQRTEFHWAPFVVVSR